MQARRLLHEVSERPRLAGAGDADKTSDRVREGSRKVGQVNARDKDIIGSAALISAQLQRLQ